MENKNLFQNYSEKQMDEMTSILNSSLECIQRATNCKSPEEKSAHLASAHQEILKLKAQDQEAHEFILHHVFDANDCSISKIFETFNVIARIFFNTK